MTPTYTLSLTFAHGTNIVNKQLTANVDIYLGCVSGCLIEYIVCIIYSFIYGIVQTEVLFTLDINVVMDKVSDYRRSIYVKVCYDHSNPAINYYLYLYKSRFIVNL